MQIKGGKKTNIIDIGISYIQFRRTTQRGHAGALAENDRETHRAARIRFTGAQRSMGTKIAGERFRIFRTAGIDSRTPCV